MVVLPHLNNSQSLIKINWCEKCGYTGAKVGDTSCWGLKIKNTVLFKTSCNYNPI